MFCSIFYKINGIPQNGNSLLCLAVKFFAEKWKEAAGFCMQVMKGGDLALCVLAASVGRWREKDPEM